PLAPTHTGRRWRTAPMRRVSDSRRHVDSKLRAYLEQAPPRPPPSDTRFTERQFIWLVPLGAAVTGGLVVVQVVPSGEWIYGAIALAALVLVASGAARFVAAIRQQLLRTGTFTSARVVSQRVEHDGEELNLTVFLEVLVEPPGEDPYRRSRLAQTYRTTLSGRWLTDEYKSPFADGASFPIVIGTGNDA